MNELIYGFVVVSKRVRQHPVWSREPMSYGQAWVDLLLLANDKPRTTTINGERIDLKRGQLAWSKRTLEGQWNRSRPWVDRFLEWCNDEAMILVDSTNRRTIITILNYDAYQRTEVPADVLTEVRTEVPADVQRNCESGTGNGKGEGHPAEIPSDSEVRDFCAGYQDLARGIQGIPEAWWTGWLAARMTARSFPRDWKRALTMAHLSDWLNPFGPGHAKARANLAQPQNLNSEKKPRRERGEILQELSLAKKNGAAESEIEALKKELEDAR